MASPPIKTFRIGAVSASVWSNPIERDGKTFERFSVKIVRNYKKDDEWIETSFFFIEDLPKLQAIASEAYKQLGLKFSEMVDENSVEEGEEI